MSYPIPVKQLRRDMALRIICEGCGREGEITPDDLNQEASWPCPFECGGEATFKYVEADHQCPACGALGFFPDAIAPCCSRVCALQMEHAATLKGAA